MALSARQWSGSRRSKAPRQGFLRGRPTAPVCSAGAEGLDLPSVDAQGWSAHATSTVLDKAVTVSEGDSLGPIGDAQLRVDVGGVPPYRLEADEERLADLAVTLPFGPRSQGVPLAMGLHLRRFGVGHGAWGQRCGCDRPRFGQTRLYQSENRLPSASHRSQ